MTKQLALIFATILIAACSSPASKPARAPIEFSGGQALIEAETLEQAQEKAKEYCNSKGKETGETRALVRESEMTKITVVCK